MLPLDVNSSSSIVLQIYMCIGIDMADWILRIAQNFHIVPIYIVLFMLFKISMDES